MEEPKKHNFIPNSTQIPNIVIDILLPRIPEAEGKCILYICRRTFGFHKEEDRISFSQFIDGIKDRQGKILDYGTGLARASVAEGLKNLLNSEAIAVTPSTKGNFYRLNLEMDVDKVVQKVNQFRRQTRSSSKSRPISVQKPYTQNLGNKEKQSISGSVDPPLDKPPNEHQKALMFWEEYVPKIRGVPAIVTKADRSNLGRVMRNYGISSDTLEQVMLYFLAHHTLKKFGTSMSTMLSAGVLSAILNHMQNDPQFWKNLNSYAERYFKPVLREEDRGTIKEAMLKLYQAFSVRHVERNLQS